MVSKNKGQSTAVAGTVATHVEPKYYSAPLTHSQHVALYCVLID